MEKLVDFIVNNWQFLAALVVAIVQIIILLVRRNIKLVDSALTGLMSVLPGYINQAESFASDGKDKFNFVLGQSVNYLVEATGKDQAYVINKYYVIIESLIEAILSTPQKKEVNKQVE